MKVSKSWLKELVDLKISTDELVNLLPLRAIGTKEITNDFIELDMKGYNRADLLSIRGVAREVAAITNSKTTFTDLEQFDESNHYSQLPVDVEDEKLCPIYCLVKIEGLKTGSSDPDWVKKLSDCGVRSINNIADITNLIMLEFGQPMHSFDADKVKDEILVVRLAKKGEKIITLDDKQRQLDPSDLLIADSEKPLGIAGVMGGKNSEASESTTTIFLEAAIFDPISIRRSVQRHNLYSEASKRFQHGLTKTNLLQALAAAVKMYEELGGKLTAISMVGNLEDEVKTVKLTQKKVNDLIGVDIKPEEVERHLESLGFSLASAATTGQAWSTWEVTVPYFRLDINIEEDLIEEVARMYGYEKIPAKPLKGELPEKIDQSLFEGIYNTKKALADLGLTEIQTYSFYSTKVLNTLGFNEKNQDKIIKIANPISSETEYLRTFIWPNLVEVIDKNMRQGYGDIAIFEIGKVYMPTKDGSPKESYHLSIALMNGTNNPLKELLHLISQGGKLIHLRGGQIEKGEPIKELEAFFHPIRFATVKQKGKVLGSLAEVHPRFLNQIGIDKRVATLEIDLENVIF